ncbi:alpha/beta hydrolase [Lachnospiraceae bacterium ZAX-1]
MKQIIKIEKKECAVYLGDEFVYGQRMHWDNASNRPLYLSLLRPRSFYANDIKVEHAPVIVWLCGGGWMQMDRKVWLPELTWFSKHGYAIASVDYPVTHITRYPEQLQDIKEAIRWLRANAEELHLDPTRICVMGESAGGHLASLIGLTDGKYDVGSNLDQSSAVQAVVSWYGPTSPVTLMKELEPTGFVTRNMMPADIENYEDALNLVKPGTPPFLLLHGTNDSSVAYTHSENLYEALETAGNTAELFLIEGAEHADELFIQDEIKQIMLDFLNQHLQRR